MGKNKGNNAAEAKSAAVAAAMKTRSPWLSAKTKKKLVKWSLLLVGPVALAAAVAFLGAPPPELDQQQANPAAAAAAQNQHNAAAADAPFSDEAPPMDEWENPNDCKAWAGGGECKNNPEFMLKNCAGSCAALDFARQKYNRRCPKPSNYTEALPAGKMASIFSRIMEDFKELEPEEISSDPPVILFHKFLRDSEAEAFVKHGRGRYEKSLGVGMKADGTMGDVATEIRTSSHGWCQHPACLNDPEVQRVTGRVADITQTPPENAEYAQLVYYNGDGQQFYRRHSDYIEGDEHKLPGVRIFTLFAYLNDVPEGGGTTFTDLPTGPVTFQPEKGKAVLWPSVLADSPHAKDDRTHHEALPVTKGEKFGANFWIHQYDFKGPHSKGCTV